MTTLTSRADGGRLAADLATHSRSLYQRGWMPGTAGNLSARLSGDPARALITASGRDKGELTEQDMIEVDIETSETTLATAPRPSAEVSIHTAIYRATRAEAVIHVHSPFATAIASSGGSSDSVTLVRIEQFELLKGLGLEDASKTDLPVIPNWAQVARIGVDLTVLLGAVPDYPPGFLIAHHGLTAWGNTLAQARNRIECLEALCQQIFYTQRRP